jgi:hypothetical protein
VFHFALNHFRQHGAAASPLFRTLSFDRLADEDLGSLALLPNLCWGFFNDSVGRPLENTRQRLQGQHEIAALQATSLQQQQRLAAQQHELDELRPNMQQQVAAQQNQIARLQGAPQQRYDRV